MDRRSKLTREEDLEDIRAIDEIKAAVASGTMKFMSKEEFYKKMGWSWSISRKKRK